MAEKNVDQYIYYHNGKEWIDRSSIENDERYFFDANGNMLGNINDVFQKMRNVLLYGTAEEQDTFTYSVPKEGAKPNRKGQYKPKDMEEKKGTVRGPIEVVSEIGEDRGNNGETFSRFASTVLGDGRVVVGRYHTDKNRNGAYQMFTFPSGTPFPTKEQVENLPFLENDKIKDIGEKGELPKLDMSSFTEKNNLENVSLPEETKAPVEEAPAPKPEPVHEEEPASTPEPVHQEPAPSRAPENIDPSDLEMDSLRNSRKRTGQQLEFSQDRRTVSQSISLEKAGMSTPQTFSVTTHNENLLSVTKGGKMVASFQEKEDGSIQMTAAKDFVEGINKAENLHLEGKLDENGNYVFDMANLRLTKSGNLDTGEVRANNTAFAIMFSALGSQIRDAAGNRAMQTNTDKPFDITVSTNFIKNAVQEKNGCTIQMEEPIFSALMISRIHLARETFKSGKTAPLHLDLQKEFGSREEVDPAKDIVLHSIPIFREGQDTKNPEYLNIMQRGGKSYLYVQTRSAKNKLTTPQFYEIRNIALQREESTKTEGLYFGLGGTQTTDILLKIDRSSNTTSATNNASLEELSKILTAEISRTADIQEHKTSSRQQQILHGLPVHPVSTSEPGAEIVSFGNVRQLEKTSNNSNSNIINQDVYHAEGEDNKEDEHDNNNKKDEHDNDKKDGPEPPEYTRHYYGVPPQPDPIDGEEDGDPSPRPDPHPKPKNTENRQHYHGTPPPPDPVIHDEEPDPRPNPTPEPKPKREKHKRQKMPKEKKAWKDLAINPPNPDMGKILAALFALSVLISVMIPISAFVFWIPLAIAAAAGINQLHPINRTKQFINWLHNLNENQAEKQKIKELEKELGKYHEADREKARLEKAAKKQRRAEAKLVKKNARTKLDKNVQKLLAKNQLLDKYNSELEKIEKDPNLNLFQRTWKRNALRDAINDVKTDISNLEIKQAALLAKEGKEEIKTSQENIDNLKQKSEMLKIVQERISSFDEAKKNLPSDAQILRQEQQLDQAHMDFTHEKAKKELLELDVLRNTNPTTLTKEQKGRLKQLEKTYKTHKSPKFSSGEMPNKQAELEIKTENLSVLKDAFLKQRKTLDDMIGYKKTFEEISRIYGGSQGLQTLKSQYESALYTTMKELSKGTQLDINNVDKYLAELKEAKKVAEETNKSLLEASEQKQEKIKGRDRKKHEKLANYILEEEKKPAETSSTFETSENKRKRDKKRAKDKDAGKSKSA